MKIDNNVSLDNLKMSDLFEIYYQLACSNINDKYIMNLINKIMDYHFTQVYDKEYTSDKTIINEEFKCIITFEK
jgi:hypothetical protein